MTLDVNQNYDLISVIMPCFNAEKFLHEAIDSVFHQTYPNVELIVIDDGSTDRTKDILHNYGDQIVMIEQDHRGPYPARNRGVKASKGEFIAFLDADDYWAPDCLEKLRNALVENKADLTYCGWQNIGAKDRSNEPYIPPKYEDGDTIQLFLKSCPWPIHAALIRRDVMETLGGFSERYFSAQDYDLWLRIIGLTQKIVRIPEVLAFYRWHENGQISAVGWKQALDAWNVRRDFISANSDLVKHLSRKEICYLTDGNLLASGYKVYWQRDLVSARNIFRQVMKTGYGGIKDWKYILPSFLPLSIHKNLICLFEKNKAFVA